MNTHREDRPPLPCPLHAFQGSPFGTTQQRSTQPPGPALLGPCLGRSKERRAPAARRKNDGASGSSSRSPVMYDFLIMSTLYCIIKTTPNLNPSLCQNTSEAGEETTEAKAAKQLNAAAAFLPAPRSWAAWGEGERAGAACRLSPSLLLPRKIEVLPRPTRAKGASESIRALPSNPISHQTSVAFTATLSPELARPESLGAAGDRSSGHTPPRDTGAEETGGREQGRSEPTPIPSPCPKAKDSAGQAGRSSSPVSRSPRLFTTFS